MNYLYILFGKSDIQRQILVHGAPICRHVFKGTVSVDNLGNIVYICHLAPGTSPDVIIWDRLGPSLAKEQCMLCECGCHDGAYKGCVHFCCPFIGRKYLSNQQDEYDKVHGFYRARSEHIFTRPWSYKVLRDIWMGSAQDLHSSMHILLHFTQFQIRRQTRYQPYSPWDHGEYLDGGVLPRRMGG